MVHVFTFPYWLLLIAFRIIITDLLVYNHRLVYNTYKSHTQIEHETKQNSGLNSKA